MQGQVRSAERSRQWQLSSVLFLPMGIGVLLIRPLGCFLVLTPSMFACGDGMVVWRCEGGRERRERRLRSEARVRLCLCRVCGAHCFASRPHSSLKCALLWLTWTGRDFLALVQCSTLGARESRFLCVYLWSMWFPRASVLDRPHVCGGSCFGGTAESMEATCGG